MSQTELGVKDDSSPRFATWELCALRQVTYPLWASVSPPLAEKKSIVITTLWVILRIRRDSG